MDSRTAARREVPDDDDWLDGRDEFEWLEDTADAPGWRAVAGGDEAGPRERRRAAATRAAAAAPPAGGARADEIRRRRAIALGGLLAVVALAIVVPVVALSGGGRGAGTPETVLPSTSISPPAGLTNAAPATQAPARSAATPAAPASASRVTVELPGGAPISAGDQGDAVVALQKALLALGYDGVGAADGVFGSATESAVTAFQGANGLVADGVVGPATAAALNAALAKSVG